MLYWMYPVRTDGIIRMDRMCDVPDPLRADGFVVHDRIILMPHRPCDMWHGGMRRMDIMPLLSHICRNIRICGILRMDILYDLSDNMYSLFHISIYRVGMLYYLPDNSWSDGGMRMDIIRNLSNCGIYRMALLYNHAVNLLLLIWNWIDLRRNDLHYRMYRMDFMYNLFNRMYCMRRMRLLRMAMLSDHTDLPRNNGICGMVPWHKFILCIICGIDDYLYRSVVDNSDKLSHVHL